MPKKYKITKEQLNDIEASKIREDKKEGGFFDGRFMSRSEKDKTKYSRKTKHKNNGEETI
jgi:hypothetical protein